VNLRLFAALAAGKLTHALLRRLKLGGGTAAPGLVAAAIDPAVLAKTTASLPRGSIVVTGTNGKTTTTRLISDMLRAAGLVPIHNRSGSNMMRGMTSAVVAASSLGGKVHADVGLWEVDEATLPDALAALNPRIVVINNLFRDQLDRYGEVNTVAAIWEKALVLLPESSTVILNADDPRVAHLGASLGRRVRYFGIEDASCALPALPDAVDSIHCLNCTRPLVYDTVFASHMGRYHCPHCGLMRPQPDIQATKIDITEHSSDVQIATPQGQLAVHLGMPGLYNAYNVLAATAAALAFGLQPEAIQQAAAHFQAAFGRMERLRAGDKEIALFLVKNPTGFNEVLRTIFGGDMQRHVLILINDLLADGTDVSWLWDVDFEALHGKVAGATVSGLRAADMALRLKYAGALPAGGELAVQPNIGQALTDALAATPSGETLYVLPTYTAMLEVKNELAQRGLSARWQDD
jgi:UDP-N-acetylmuramyl tripeptide synthase